MIVTLGEGSPTLRSDPPGIRPGQGDPLTAAAAYVERGLRSPSVACKKFAMRTPARLVLLAHIDHVVAGRRESFGQV